MPQWTVVSGLHQTYCLASSQSSQRLFPPALRLLSGLFGKLDVTFSFYTAVSSIWHSAIQVWLLRATEGDPCGGPSCCDSAPWHLGHLTYLCHFHQAHAPVAIISELVRAMDFYNMKTAFAQKLRAEQSCDTWTWIRNGTLPWVTWVLTGCRWWQQGARNPEISCQCLL